jgi:hypothetical protein
MLHRMNVWLRGADLNRRPQGYETEGRVRGQLILSLIFENSRRCIFRLLCELREGNALVAEARGALDRHHAERRACTRIKLPPRFDGPIATGQFGAPFGAERVRTKGRSVR